jgi:hypothetical protein
MGYHPGVEDDAVYLSAVKADLHPTLFPHDADFFRLQLQATVFDGCIAKTVEITHLAVPGVELLVQLLNLFSILWASCTIARRIFPKGWSCWGGVALLSAMFTLPVAGTALYICDQHLHPRNIATAFILFAVDRILARKNWQAIPLLILAVIMHPIMAALGISFCCFLWACVWGPEFRHRRHTGNTLAAAVPMGWIFEPPSPTWREALATRRYYFLNQWEWYEWLGAIGPLILFWILSRWAQRTGRTLLARFALSVALFGVFQQMVSIVVLATPQLVRLTPMQPMRYLHLVYLFTVICAGCLAAEFLLKRSLWRWVLFVAATGIGMFIPQRLLYPATPHLEMPWTQPASPWLQAFAWIRENTPEDAYFAAGPRYMEAPGEDYHGFRALAERSALADLVKDSAVVTQVPQLGPRWDREARAQVGWEHFGPADFERLKREFGVDWVLVTNSRAAGLSCPWHNDQLAVCRVP